LQPQVCNVSQFIAQFIMEHSPITPNPIIESDAKTSESRKDKKDSKKSKAIGSLAFERTEPKTSKADKSPLINEPAFTLFESSEKSKDGTDSKAFVPEAAAVAADADAEKQTDQPELSADDRLYAAQQIALERQTELTAELPAEDNESEAASTAAQEFYDKIISDNQQPEAAADSVLAQIDSIETSAQPDTEAAVDKPLKHPATPVVNAGAGSGGNGNISPNRRGPGLTAPQPPSNPNLPLQPTPNITGSLLTPTPNAAPNIASAPNQNRANYEPYYNSYNRYNRPRASSDLLIGSIVGYLIGRRRGRIKTERKLLPVQHKLEREVSGLKKTIVEKETLIRQAAVRRVREQQLVTAATVPLHGEKASSGTVMLRRRETTLERPRSLDRPISAPEIHGRRMSAPPERIGHVLVAAEMLDSKPIIRAEQQQTTEATTTKDFRSVERQVETLSRNELLTLSEKVIVEGSTLRQVYETQLISERGLRRLITEYLRGGDVLKAFRRELVEREIDFERDPKLRDKVRQGLRGGGASPTLHKLLEQAGVAPIDESRQSIAEARAQQLYEAKQQAKQKSHRKVMDVSLITIIAVLFAIIIVLAIHKM
jgi:hypothetical protein